MGNLGGGLFVLVVLVAELAGKAAASTYVVGDNLGWSVPSTANEYSSWASRHVFMAGDVLVFNFITGQHDVGEVTKAAFDGCSSTSPIKLATVGPWNVTLNSTGEHFFICTFGSHCSLGQKLAINVTASPSGSPAPSPPMLPPSVAPTPSGSSPPTASPAPMPPMPMPPTPSPMSMPGSPGSAPSMSPAGVPTPSPMSMPGSPGSAPSMSPAGVPIPGGVPTSPGGLSPTSPPPPPPGNSASLSTISATLVVFASVAFGLTV